MPNCRVDDFSVVYAHCCCHCTCKVLQVPALQPPAGASQVPMVLLLSYLNWTRSKSQLHCDQPWWIRQELERVALKDTSVGASQSDCRLRSVLIHNLWYVLWSDSGGCLNSLGSPGSILSLSKKDYHLPYKFLLGLGQGLVIARSQSRRAQSLLTHSVWILLCRNTQKNKSFGGGKLVEKSQMWLAHVRIGTLWLQLTFL